MAMSKKDFIALGDVMKRLRPGAVTPLAGGHKSLSHADGYNEGAERQWEFTLIELAAFCAEQNPRFMRERWLGYVRGENGPRGGEVKQ